jgi:kumamolisin
MSKRFVLLVILALLATALCLERGGFADEPTVTLEGQRPVEWDLTGAEPAPPDIKIPRLQIIFATQNQAESEKLLNDLQNPDSPQFGHPLTSRQIHERFGESHTQFLAVVDWLKSRGFQIRDLTYGRSIDSIAFTGTIGQVEQAFQVQIVWFKQTGKYANTNDPQIPMRFRGVIGGIAGLYNLGGAIPQFKRSEGTTPEIKIGTETGFSPKDFYTFYSLNSLKNVNGSGNDCIALIEASNFPDSAVKDFDSTFQVIDPNPNPIPRVFADGIDPGDLGGDPEIEALEDIEWAHAVAPGAPLKVYIGNINVAGSVDQALFDATQDAVSDNSCGSISLSYANCSPSFDFAMFHGAFSQAAGNQQTVFVASGDTGSAGLVPPRDCRSAIFRTGLLTRNHHAQRDPRWPLAVHPVKVIRPPRSHS